MVSPVLTRIWNPVKSLLTPSVSKVDALCLPAQFIPLLLYSILHLLVSPSSCTVSLFPCPPSQWSLSPTHCFLSLYTVSVSYMHLYFPTYFFFCQKPLKLSFDFSHLSPELFTFFLLTVSMCSLVHAVPLW